jgi:bifunctional DNase/RNase
MAMVEMRLAGVKVELPTNTPVVLLQEVGGEQRTLPIFVGMPEATSMLHVLQGQSSPRPLTYDLFATVLEEAGARLEQVVITDLREGTYYAELHLVVAKTRKIVSARPSDAINLALRAGCLIVCDDDLLAAEGVRYDPEEESVRMAADSEPQADVLVDELKEWLEHIRPEDFG